MRFIKIVSCTTFRGKVVHLLQPTLPNNSSTFDRINSRLKKTEKSNLLNINKQGCLHKSNKLDTATSESKNWQKANITFSTSKNFLSKQNRKKKASQKNLSSFHACRLYHLYHLLILLNNS